MQNTEPLQRPPFAGHRAYAFAEVLAAMIAATVAALGRAWRRLEERRRLARLHEETRHLSPHLLKDIGLWDEGR